MTVLAAIGSTIGAKALYLLFAWLLSAAIGAWLSDRKGYGEWVGLTFGLVLTVVGLLIVLGLPGRPGSKWRGDDPDYPIQLEVEYSARHNRLAVLFRYPLLLPYVLATIVIWLVSVLITITAWLMVMLAGHYPRPLFHVLVRTMRWKARGSAYGLLLTDRYPLFSVGEASGYPVRLEVDYPEMVARWQALLSLVLLIPSLMAAIVLRVPWIFLALLAWVRTMLTGGYPHSMSDALATNLRGTVGLLELGLAAPTARGARTTAIHAAADA